MLQPSMRKGPWQRPQLCSTYPLEIVSSSSAHCALLPLGQFRMSRFEQTPDAVLSSLVADGVGFASAVTSASRYSI